MTELSDLFSSFNQLSHGEQRRQFVKGLGGIAAAFTGLSLLPSERAKLLPSFEPTEAEMVQELQVHIGRILENLEVLGIVRPGSSENIPAIVTQWQSNQQEIRALQMPKEGKILLNIREWLVMQ